MRDKMLEQIDAINDQVTRMGSMVLESIEHSFKAFKDIDTALAEDVIERDKYINKMEEEIEDMCVRLAVTQSPVASDLRRMVTVLKVVTDLERIGDHSCNISEVVLAMGKKRCSVEAPKLLKMKDEVKSILSDTLKAYYSRDLELARASAKRDDLVDEMYEEIYHDLLRKIKEESWDVDLTIGYIVIGRYLERIADHATNISERLIYLKTGEHVKY